MRLKCTTGAKDRQFQQSRGGPRARTNRGAIPDSFQRCPQAGQTGSRRRKGVGGPEFQGAKDAPPPPGQGSSWKLHGARWPESASTACQAQSQVRTTLVPHHPVFLPLRNPVRSQTGNLRVTGDTNGRKPTTPLSLTASGCQRQILTGRRSLTFE